MFLSGLVTAALARTDIAVLVSDTLTAYEEPVAAFRATVARAATVYDLEGDRDRADVIVKQLAADPPPLVFALGAKAAYMAVNYLPNTPVVYAMVGEPARYGIGGTQVTGVSSDVPPEAVLSQFKLFAPNVERLGVLLASGNTGKATSAAIEAGKALGYDVTVVRVTNPRDLRAAWERMAEEEEVDALWLLPDPVVMTPESFRYLRGATLRRDVPMIAATETLVRAGALLCVTPDREVLGQQAGELALRVLEGGELPGMIEPLPPGAIRVVLNRDTLDAVGLRVDPLLLDFADEVVREEQGR
ncbi:MAG: ABC transporter substrate-binding protein [Myxococcota bacterium]